MSKDPISTNNEIAQEISEAEIAAAVGNPASDTVAIENGFGVTPTRQSHRGMIRLPDGRQCIGRVGAPPGQEATSSKFAFWIPEDVLVEAAQIVTARCRVPGDPSGTLMTYYALTEEVHRCSRRRGMGHEVDEWDGVLDDEPPYASEGITYATAAILRTEPAYLTPPREHSPVLIASDKEAQDAYGASEISNEKRLAVGVIKNGGVMTAGPGYIDLDYLLGANGGHLNVSGAAGRATKSSFLVTVIKLLLDKVEKDAAAHPSAIDPLSIVPIIFNVKNFDLFYLDCHNRRYAPDKHAGLWGELGVVKPTPFRNVTYYAPQREGTSPLAIDTGRNENGPDNKPLVKPYSWSLADVVKGGLLPFLFSDEDAGNDNFAALVLDLENWLTSERDNNGDYGKNLTPRDGSPTDIQRTN